MAFGLDVKQTNIVANPARHLIFFEGSDLCYNYKTNQWTRITAYDGLGLYGVNSKVLDIGLVIYSSGSVDLQDQNTLGDKQVAILTTGSSGGDQGDRFVVDSVRPLVNGGTNTVRVGVQDALDDSITWSTGSALNSRTNKVNFRAADNYPEGRYIRVETTITGGFTTAIGTEIEFNPSGKI